MPYTLNLIKMGVNSFVPFSDKIPGMQDAETAQFSKRKERNRINIAKSMKQAIKEGKLEASYSSAVDKINESAQKNLTEASYLKNQYAFDQINKLGPLLDVFVPGSGIVASNLAQAATAKNLYQYAEQAPSTTETALKLGQVAASTLLAVSSPLWMPLVTPLITTSVIAMGVAALFGTTLTLDAVGYLRG